MGGRVSAYNGTAWPSTDQLNLNWGQLSWIFGAECGNYQWILNGSLNIILNLILFKIASKLKLLYNLRSFTHLSTKIVVRNCSDEWSWGPVRVEIAAYFSLSWSKSVKARRSRFLTPKPARRVKASRMPRFWLLSQPGGKFWWLPGVYQTWYFDHCQSRQCNFQQMLI